MVAQTCNPSPREFRQAWELHGEFKAHLKYTMRPCLKKANKQKQKPGRVDVCGFRFLRQGLSTAQPVSECPIYPRMTSNSRSSCLSFQILGFTGIHHHVWPHTYFTDTGRKSLKRRLASLLSYKLHNTGKMQKEKKGKLESRLTVIRIPGMFTNWSWLNKN